MTFDCEDWLRLVFGGLVNPTNSSTYVQIGSFVSSQFGLPLEFTIRAY